VRGKYEVMIRKVEMVWDGRGIKKGMGRGKGRG
jgi:hypothetical protein